MELRFNVEEFVYSCKNPKDMEKMTNLLLHIYKRSQIDPVSEWDLEYQQYRHYIRVKIFKPTMSEHCNYIQS